MTEVLRVFVSANETGGTLQIQWNGAADAQPVYFGSDEMMSLTPREREIRNTVLALLAADAPSTKSVEAATPEAHGTPGFRLIVFYLFATLGMLLIVPGFCLGLATGLGWPVATSWSPIFSTSFFLTLVPIGLIVELLAALLLVRKMRLQSDRGPQDPALPAT